MKTIEEKVARLAELHEGRMKQVRVGETDVVLLRQGGQVYAMGATCPHYGAPLAEGTLCDGHIVCPWHASIFKATSGDLLEPPSLDGLPRFSVRVEEGEVYVSVPEQSVDARTMPMCRPDPKADDRLFAIVGKGAAASAAAETLRQSDFRGRILMIGPEDALPYDRTNCSKGYLTGDVSDKAMLLRDEEFYQQHGIEHLTARVERLEVDRRTLVLDTGKSLTADAILVATGGVPRGLDVPGADLTGVMTLRSWADCRAIREAAQAAKKAVVVGAGFIGCEVAASLAGQDIEVTIVAPESVPLQKQLGQEVGEVIRQLHDDKGTAFRLGHAVTRIHGDQAVRQVELDNGERLPADLVVVGLGVIPATDFLQGVSRNDDGSVNVDKRLRLAENVYAAGDIARYPDPFTDRHIRIEHWRLAQQHGRFAGQVMAGKDVGFQGVPFFWTRQFGVSLMYAGCADEWDEVLIEGDPAAREFTAFYAKDDRLLAAAGTQDKPIAVFLERMRTGSLPPAAELHHHALLDLAETAAHGS